MMTTNNEAFEKWWDSYCREMNIDESAYSGNSFAIGKSNMKFGYNAAKAECEKEITELRSRNHTQLDLIIKQDNDRAELQASNNRLREALERAVGYIPAYTVNKKDFDMFQEALTSTPVQSLAEFENEVIERCAKVVDESFCHDPMGAEALITVSAAIRELKGQV